MGLNHLRAVLSLAACFSIAGAVEAAPTLRLVSSTVGPVTAAQGSNAATQTVEAYNAGDGSLNLSISSSATWLTGSVGGARACTRRSGTCLPINFSLNTSGLAAGTYTAIATVSDSNAVDAPQTITVTAQVGTGVPASVDLYTSPTGSADYSFYTNSPLTLKSSTGDSNSWLTVALDGSGSFQFVYPYRIHVAPVSGQANGAYSGSVTTSGSSFGADNRTIPVTMRVTGSPIVSLKTDDRPVSTVTPAGIRVKLAEGAPRYDLSLQLANLGLGTLTVSSATSTGGDWLAVVTAAPAYVTALFDASKLTAGSYTGSLTINTNAANGNLTLPVALTVTPKSAPVIRYQGVVDNAVFAAGDAVTRGDILALVGEQLSFAAITLGKAPPLDTTVGGARVLVNGQPAPMYYSTYGQLAFQMPFEVGNGTAQVQVERDGQRSNIVTVEVADRAPRLLRLGIEDYGAIVNQDGSLPMLRSVSVPGWSTHPAKRGDTLTIYAIGLGATTPSVATGTAAPTDPLARTTVTPVVNFGGGPTAAKANPFFSGLTPTAAGLYQLNVTIPEDCPKGIVAVSVGFPDSLSNIVQIAVE